MAASSDGNNECDGKNERNFLQMHRLLAASARVLRAKFESKVPTFPKWPPSVKDLKKAKLSEKQIQHMKQHPGSDNYDISLLISLLRHFCYKADLKNALWEETDNDKIIPSQTQEIADIVRIRNLRNKVCILLIYFCYLLDVCKCV